MKSIDQQFFFPHPAEDVWKYLTTAELLEQWLMKNDFQPVVGHHFQFRTSPKPALNFDGIFHCQVLEIVPFKKLSYSWKGGPGNGEFAFDSLVEWTLQTTDKGTDLFLKHSGFSSPDTLGMYTAMMNGWPKNIQKIIDRLNAAKS